MSTKRLKYCLLILILGAGAGCEKEVSNLILPEFKQKLAVAAFISPSDTVSLIYVNSNKKIFGELNTEEPIGKLSGYISDGFTEIALDTFKYGLKFSRKEMAVSFGKSYRLRIVTDKGLTAEAACTVPPARNFTFKIDTFSVQLRTPWPDYLLYRSNEFIVTIADIPGEDNYYRISGRITAYYTDLVTGMKFISTGFPNFDNEFFTDKGMDGKDIVIRTDIGSSMNFYTRDSAFLEIALLNTEKSYYLYHRSLQNYSDGDNPFMEVSPVYSNITDGLGIFSSYTIDSLFYRIR